ncbi:MAG: hypothetical protein PVJ57_16155 [Phycisphaerae bacterium]|jgi:tetratricopeptide (TPR) repeat protein
MSRRSSPVAACAAALAAVATWATLTWACGPFFPNRLLVQGDKALLWAPVADFCAEVERLCPAGPAPFQAQCRDDHDGAAETAESAQADLQSALTDLGRPPKASTALLTQYAEMRDVLRRRASAVQAWESPMPWWRNQSKKERPTLPPLTIPADLPPEFAHYDAGAVAFYRGDTTLARDEWQAVLNLAAEQRRYRSTWAAFMLGKCTLDSDPAEAVRRFEQVRELATAGFRDSLGLAASSLGWQARAELQRGQFEQTVDLYMQQQATGDPTAMSSLRMVAGRLSQLPPADLRRAAAHVATQRLLTAYFIARGGPRTSRRPEDDLLDRRRNNWLEAVEAAATDNVAGAERLAWAAYQAGRMDTAERWLARANPDEPIVHWLRAKLLLRAGRIDEAATHLAAAAHSFPADEAWTELADDQAESEYLDTLPAERTLGELGVLHLARRQYAEALDALLRARFWMDAAYVAESVLTIDELAAYVDQHWPAVSADRERPVIRPRWQRSPELDDELAVRIRHLLARRLIRAGQYTRAEPYCPREWQPELRELAAGLATGRDTAQPAAERAAALWQAARLTRYDGLELLGTELDPDWYSLAGNNELSLTRLCRVEPTGNRLNRASPDEQTRARRHALKSPHRWHYRYLAADLGWQAASLMPNESDETARVLCEAGSWLKALDPPAADRFYKALVRRCRTTTLGRDADRLRWFPDLSEYPATQPAPNAEP